MTDEAADRPRQLEVKSNQQDEISMFRLVDFHGAYPAVARLPARQRDIALIFEPMGTGNARPARRGCESRARNSSLHITSSPSRCPWPDFFRPIALYSEFQFKHCALKASF